MVDQLVDALAAGRPGDLPGTPPSRHGPQHYWSWYDDAEPARAGGHDGVCSSCADGCSTATPTRLDWAATRTFHRLYAESGHPTLAELSVILDDLGVDGGTYVLFAWGSGSDFRTAFGERPDDEVARVHRPPSRHGARPRRAGRARVRAGQACAAPRAGHAAGAAGPRRGPPVRRGAGSAEGRAPRGPGSAGPGAGYLRADHPRAGRLADRAARRGGRLVGTDRRPRGGRAAGEGVRQGEAGPPDGSDARRPAGFRKAGRGLPAARRPGRPGAEGGGQGAAQGSRLVPLGPASERAVGRRRRRTSRGAAVVPQPGGQGQVARAQRPAAHLHLDVRTARARGARSGRARGLGRRGHPTHLVGGGEAARQ